jgi:hypothetical protein
MRIPLSPVTVASLRRFLMENCTPSSEFFRDPKV